MKQHQSQSAKSAELTLRWDRLVKQAKKIKDKIAAGQATKDTSTSVRNIDSLCQNLKNYRICDWKTTFLTMLMQRYSIIVKLSLTTILFFSLYYSNISVDIPLPHQWLKYKKQHKNITMKCKKVKQPKVHKKNIDIYIFYVHI